jgi:hypothetical protein
MLRECPRESLASLRARSITVSQPPPALFEVVPQSTLRHWARRGWTSFGLSLDIVVRKRRLLIPELKALVVKEFLHDYPLPRPGISSQQREEFRRAADWFSLIRPRSPYSRARQPPEPKTPHP